MDLRNGCGKTALKRRLDAKIQASQHGLTYIYTGTWNTEHDMTKKVQNDINSKKKSAILDFQDHIFTLFLLNCRPHSVKKPRLVH